MRIIMRILMETILRYGTLMFMISVYQRLVSFICIHINRLKSCFISILGVLWIGGLILRLSEIFVIWIFISRKFSVLKCIRDLRFLGKRAYTFSIFLLVDNLIWVLVLGLFFLSISELICVYLVGHKGFGYVLFAYVGFR